MKHKKWFSIAVLTLALLVAMVLVADVAYAQGAGPSKGPAKSMGEKKGMDALASKKFDEKRLPGTKQYVLTGVSIAACVIIMKYF